MRNEKVHHFLCEHLPLSNQLDGEKEQDSGNQYDNTDRKCSGDNSLLHFKPSRLRIQLFKQFMIQRPEHDVENSRP